MTISEKDLDWAFGPNFKRWIAFLDNRQEAIATLEGYNMVNIKIVWGVWQGCSLSPLLYNLGLESLAIVIRANKQIEGIVMQDHILKISLNVDDIVYFLRKPETSLKILSQLITDFGSISRYKVNLYKSILSGILY